MQNVAITPATVQRLLLAAAAIFGASPAFGAEPQQPTGGVAVDRAVPGSGDDSHPASGSDAAGEEGERDGAPAPAYRSTVSARRFVPGEATGAPQEVVGEEARRLPLIDDDLLRSLHLVPGVQADDYSARFALRGGERDEVEVVLDGVPVFDPFHLQDYGGAISSIDLGLVETARLLADGFPARYGDRTGGVLEVTTRSGRAGHSAVAGFDLLNAHAQALGPLGDGDYLVSLRRGYIDLFLEAWAADVGFRPSYWDAFAKVSQDLGARDTVTVQGLWATDTNTITRDAPKPDLASRYTNGTAWARWERRLPRGARVTGALAWGQAERDRQEGSWGWDRRQVRQLLGQQEWRVALGPRAGLLSWGARLRWSEGDYDYRLDRATDLTHAVTRELVADTRVYGAQTSLFVQHDAQPLPWLRTTLGVRASHLQGVDSFSPAPRVAVAVLPVRRLTLRAAWGLYYQPVLPHDLPVHAGVTTLQLPEMAEHRVAGALWRPGPWLHLRAETYWRTSRRLVGYVPDLGKEERVFTRPDEAVARGVEVEARGFPLGGRLGWLVGYSLARADEWASGGPHNPRSSDVRHALTAGLDADLGRLGRLSVAYRYHSGLPYTPAAGLGTPAPGQPPQVIYGAANSARLPAFHSLDARLTREWLWPGWALRGYLQVVNATLRANVEEVVNDVVGGPDGTWQIRTTRGEYFPILPTLGAEVQW